MPKSKHAPALFEVIHKVERRRRRELSIPKWWWKRRSASTEQSNVSGSTRASEGSVTELPPSSPGPSPEPQADADLERRSEPTSDTMSAPPRAEDAPSEASPPSEKLAAEARSSWTPPWEAPSHLGDDEALIERPPHVTLHEGRVWVSLNPTGAVVTVGVICLLLFASFQLGQHRGYVAGLPTEAAAPPPKAIHSVDEARRSEPDASVLQVPLVSKKRPSRPRPDVPVSPKSSPPKQPERTAQAPPPASPSGRTTGWTYLVVQQFKNDRRGAEQAQRFLQQQCGVPTSIEKVNGGWALVTVKGFDCTKPARKREFQAYWDRIKGFGKIYVDQGGQYALGGFPKRY